MGPPHLLFRTSSVLAGVPSFLSPGERREGGVGHCAVIMLLGESSLGLRIHHEERGLK